MKTIIPTLQTQWLLTHMFLYHSCDEGSIQQPVVHRLVLEGNAADVSPTIHIPSPNTHSELLRGGEVTPAVTYALLERNGACVCMQSCVFVYIHVFYTHVCVCMLTFLLQL